MQPQARNNVFIFGQDEFNLRQLQSVRGAERCRFHELASYREMRSGGAFHALESLERARAVLKHFPDRVNAIIGWWDFPVSTALPILRREQGLQTPSLESVLKCEHKYWSRLEQTACVAENTPRFAAFNPFDEAPLRATGLRYPLWIKPVKSASSYLGFRISDDAQLATALDTIRREIHTLAEPFNHILSYAELPAEIAAIDGSHCIAEQIISRGRQCTLEGYVFDGEVSIYGAVDSIREGRYQSSFARYQYPSTLPPAVQQRMGAITERFIRHIGLDFTPFNVEYYWDAESDAIWLLELNVRISKSHCPLFHMVDGEYHHKVNLDIGLGRHPDFPHRRGQFAVAAKFMLRHHQDARVTRAPAARQIAAVRERFPETELNVHVREGMRLSQLKAQDSYSYEVAEIFMGAASERQLLADYHEAVDMLGFEYDAR